MGPVDPRGRFAGAASGYARFRPSYPASLVDWRRALFDAHARGGVLEFPYRAVGLVFRVARSERSASAIRS